MTIFKKNIAYTKTPLNSEYESQDYFKVYPFKSEKFPINKSSHHFPCIIEIAYDEKEVKGIKPFDLKNIDQLISETATQTNKLIEVTNLLTSITNFHFFFYRHMEGSWSIPLTKETKDKMDIVRSEWSVPLFYYPQLADEFKLDGGFSKTEFEKVNFVDRKKYYFYNPVESGDKFIDFPSDINEVVSAYVKLDEKSRAVANSTIFQFCNGIELRDKMKSLSYLSVVSSIETLANHEFADKVEFKCDQCKTLKTSTRTCSKCGRPIWGLAAKFRELLFQFVSDRPEAKKLYNKIYDIRSKIAHTDYLIVGDNFLDWDFTESRDKISHNHIEAIQLARRVISNWLKSKAPKVGL